ncbi:single-stranded DNA endonuclease [Sphingobium sp. TA15]|uniref:Single-stranded DNA endonuclease n=1 Tax=Sphingobium indicum (strain DSM 16413 / CCM 7287 / MTCC 6362 / UT26 / NBRC 101211 / UT26S) TaxID=452662 RepID=D4Z5E1_SPHIU|nr:DUF2958 domain-containing protein [Sphingobium indicum]BAI97823.1 hypothetical protein SJA_C1-29890 [Sphingobium indicum UT26S]BDD67215.1 single-stranded DNA endonuclease [Sphingobium sp. TA15]
MILLSYELRARLRAQARASAETLGSDPCPIAKFFNPLGAATWLATELARDGDTLFGLADLGFGCPELGYFSLREIEAIRLPFGLRIERDLAFTSLHPLSVWADTARRAGSILAAQSFLARSLTARPTDELPPP